MPRANMKKSVTQLDAATDLHFFHIVGERGGERGCSGIRRHSSEALPALRRGERESSVVTVSRCVRSKVSGIALSVGQYG